MIMGIIAVGPVSLGDKRDNLMLHRHIYRSSSLIIPKEKNAVPPCPEPSPINNHQAPVPSFSPTRCRARGPLGVIVPTLQTVAMHVFPTSFLDCL